MRNAGEEEKKIFENVSQANSALIDLETRIFELGAKGKLQEAQVLMKGEEYNYNKKIYSEAVIQFFENQKNRLSATLKKQNFNYRLLFYSAFILSILGLGATTFIIVWLSRGVIKPLEKAANYSQGISKGDLTVEIMTSGKGEFADLFRSISFLVSKIGRVG